MQPLTITTDIDDIPDVEVTANCDGNWREGVNFIDHEAVDQDGNPVPLTDKQIDALDQLFERELERIASIQADEAAEAYAESRRDR